MRYDWLADLGDDRPEPPADHPVREARETAFRFAEVVDELEHADAVTDEELFELDEDQLRSMEAVDDDLVEEFQRLGARLESDGETLREAVESPDAGVRLAAAEGLRALIEAGGGAQTESIEERFVELTSGLFEDDDPHVVREAVALLRAVAEADPEAVSSELMGLGSFFDPELPREPRENAARAVRSIVEYAPFQYGFVESEVESAVDDPYPSVAEHARRTFLAALLADETENYDVLKRIADDADADHEGLRAVGARAAGVLVWGDPDRVESLVPALVESLGSGAVETVEAAAEALASVAIVRPDPVVDGASDLLAVATDDGASTDARESALEAVVNLTDAVGRRAAPALPVDPLVELLSDEGGDRREYAALVLGNMEYDFPPVDAPGAGDVSDAADGGADNPSEADEDADPLSAFGPAVDPLVEWYESAPADREPLHDLQSALGVLSTATDRRAAAREVAEDLVDRLAGGPDQRHVAARELASLARGAPGLVAEALGVAGADGFPADDPGEGPAADLCRAMLAPAVPEYADRRILDSEFDDPSLSDRYLSARGLERVAATEPSVIEPFADHLTEAYHDEQSHSVQAWMLRAMGHVATEAVHDLAADQRDRPEYAVRAAAEAVLADAPEDWSADAGPEAAGSGPTAGTDGATGSDPGEDPADDPFESPEAVPREDDDTGVGGDDELTPPSQGPTAEALALFRRLHRIATDLEELDEATETDIMDLDPEDLLEYDAVDEADVEFLENAEEAELEDAAETLFVAMLSEDPSDNLAAAEGFRRMMEINPEEADEDVEMLLGLLDVEQPAIAREAVGLAAALAEGAPRLLVGDVHRLAPHLAPDAGAERRRQAFEAARRVVEAHPETYDPVADHLRTALDDDDSAVRADAGRAFAAAYGAGEADDREALDRVLAGFEARDADPEAWAAAATALARVAERHPDLAREHADELVDALDPEAAVDDAVRTAAVEAVDPVAVVAPEAVAPALPSLVAVAADPGTDDEIRETALRAVAIATHGVGVVEDLPTDRLVDLIDDDAVADAAVDAVETAARDDPSAVADAADRLVEQYERAPSAPDAFVPLHALGGLAADRPDVVESVVDDVAGRLDDPDDRPRAAYELAVLADGAPDLAAETLGVAGAEDPDAVEDGLGDSVQADLCRAVLAEAVPAYATRSTLESDDPAGGDEQRYLAARGVGRVAAADHEAVRPIVDRLAAAYREEELSLVRAPLLRAIGRTRTETARELARDQRDHPAYVVRAAAEDVLDSYDRLDDEAVASTDAVDADDDVGTLIVPGADEADEADARDDAGEDGASASADADEDWTPTPGERGPAATHRERPPDPPADSQITDLLDQMRADAESVSVFEVGQVAAVFGQGLTSGDPRVRRGAVEGLRHLIDANPDSADDQVDFFVDTLTDDVDAVVREGIALVDVVAEANPGAIASELETIAPVLTHEESAMREFAASAVGSVLAERPDRYDAVADQIERAVDDPDPAVRERARDAFILAAMHGHADDPAVFEQIADGIDADHAGLRASAAWAVSVFADRHPDLAAGYVEGLAGALDDADEQVRSLAATALAELSAVDPEAVAPALDALVGVLAEADPDLDDVGDPQASAFLSAANVADALGPVDDLPIDRLLGLLGDENPGTSQIAAAILGYAATHDPAPVAAAADPILDWYGASPADREEPLHDVLFALGWLASERPDPVRDVAEDLAGRLDGSRTVTARELAALAAGAPGVVAGALGVADHDGEGLPEDGLGEGPEADLCRALLAGEVPAYADPSILESESDDPEVGTRRLGALGLERVTAVDPSLTAPLVEHLVEAYHEEDDESVRAALLRAIGRTRTEAARELARDQRDHSAYVVRAAAEAVLDDLDGEDLTDEDLADPDRDHPADHGGAGDPEGSADRDATDDGPDDDGDDWQPDPDERGPAAAHPTRPEDPPAGSPIAQTLDRVRADVESVTQFEIGQIAATFGQGLTAGDPAVRRAAVEGLRHLVEAHPDAADDEVDAFVGTLTDDDPAVVREAAALVDALTDANPGAIASEMETVAPLADHEEPAVRDHALSAVADVLEVRPDRYDAVRSHVEAAADDPDPTVRATARGAYLVALVTGETEDRSILEEALADLDADHPDLREAAAVAVGAATMVDPDQGSEYAADLVDLADDDHPEVREAAAFGLQELAPYVPAVVAEAARPLTELALDDDRDDDASQDATAAVVNAAEVVAVDLPVEAVVEALGDRSYPAALIAGTAALDDPESLAAAADPLVDWYEWYESATDDGADPLQFPLIALGALAEERPDAVRDVAEDLVDSLPGNRPRRARELAALAVGAPDVAADALGVADHDGDGNLPDDDLGESYEADVCRALLAREVPAYAHPSILESEADEQSIADRELSARGLERVASVDPSTIEPFVEQMAQGYHQEDEPVVQAQFLRAIGHTGTETARELARDQRERPERVVREAAEDVLADLESADADGADGAGESDDSTGGSESADNGGADESDETDGTDGADDSTADDAADADDDDAPAGDRPDAVTLAAHLGDPGLARALATLVDRADPDGALSEADLSTVDADDRERLAAEGHLDADEPSVSVPEAVAFSFDDE